MIMNLLRDEISPSHYNKGCNCDASVIFPPTFDHSLSLLPMPAKKAPAKKPQKKTQDKTVELPGGGLQIRFPVEGDIHN